MRATLGRLAASADMAEATLEFGKCNGDSQKRTSSATRLSLISDVTYRISLRA